eukprot:COSAG02_NODE_39_length_48074_cov_106.508890_30_plen_82_part_00
MPSLTRGIQLARANLEIWMRSNIRFYLARGSYIREFWGAHPPRAAADARVHQRAVDGLGDINSYCMQGCVYHNCGTSSGII